MSPEAQRHATRPTTSLAGLMLRYLAAFLLVAQATLVPQASAGAPPVDAPIHVSDAGTFQPFIAPGAVTATQSKPTVKSPVPHGPTAVLKPVPGSSGLGTFERHICPRSDGIPPRQDRTAFRARGPPR